MLLKLRVSPGPRVEVLRGAASRDKTVLVRDAAPDAVRNVLQAS